MLTKCINFIWEIGSQYRLKRCQKYSFLSLTLGITLLRVTVLREKLQQKKKKQSVQKV
jgi:hypothetical protein